jgi:hypothetical protein
MPRHNPAVVSLQRRPGQMLLLSTSRYSRQKSPLDMPMLKQIEGGGIASTPSHLRRYNGMGGQNHTPAAVRLGYTRYTLHRRLGGPRGWSGPDSVSGPSSRYRVATPTGLSWPPVDTEYRKKLWPTM